jgi:hypothetical protein
MPEATQTGHVGHQRGPPRAGGSGQCDPGSRLHGRMGWDTACRGRRGNGDLVIQCRARF